MFCKWALDFHNYFKVTSGVEQRRDRFASRRIASARLDVTVTEDAENYTPRRLQTSVVFDVDLYGLSAVSFCVIICTLERSIEVGLKSG
jgi:hypothetical protein